MSIPRPRRGGAWCAAIVLIMGGLGHAHAGGFDVGGLLGGVMQGAIQANQQHELLERQQEFQRQQMQLQQLQYQRQLGLERQQYELGGQQQPDAVATGVADPAPQAPAPVEPAHTAPLPIDGHALGAILPPESLSADMKCHASEQFAGFQWCRSRKAVNSVWTSTSIILSSSNAIAYYTKFFEAASFQSGAVMGEIGRLSGLHHQQARVLRMPGASGEEGAVIATWGALTLTPLDAATTNSLAGGESVTAGVMVDFLNNVRESAKRGLPIYRLSGGDGYYWIAHYGRNGQGNLRFGICDAQVFDGPKAPPPPPAVAAAPAPAPAEPPKAAVAVEPRSAVPEIETARPATPPAPIVTASATVSDAPSGAAPQTAVTPSIAALPDIPNQGRRVALVIGNSAYEQVPRLDNPKHDAEDVAEALKAAGFDSVTLVTDASLPVMKKALRDLEDQADHADWAMVYYAGHGIEFGDENYLVPIDAHLVSDRDAEDEAVSLTHVLGRLSGVKKLRLVVLDACRENPFNAKVQRHDATRDLTRGLARFEPQIANEMVVYAAKANQLAQDGTSDGHSPFAKALIARLATPRLEINKLFRMVTNDVEIATNANQQPFVYGSTPGLDDFYFRTQ